MFSTQNGMFIGHIQGKEIIRNILGGKTPDLGSQFWVGANKSEEIERVCRCKRSNT